MKSILSVMLLFTSLQSFAIDNLCVTKQKNAASFELAQEIGVPVQDAEVINFQNGPWTEATGNNSGSDKVTVRVGNRYDRGMTVKTYRVNGKQVGTTSDCDIVSLVEDKL